MNCLAVLHGVCAASVAGPTHAPLSDSLQALASDSDATLQHQVADLQARLDASTKEVSFHQKTIAELVCQLFTCKVASFCFQTYDTHS